MRAKAVFLTVALGATALLSGCAVGAVTPSKPKPFGAVAREEKGVVVSVRDTRIDLRTGMGRALSTPSPAIPVGPIGVRVPMTIGGEKKAEMPGEEITVKLSDGKLVMIVQELSSPPFAQGESVRVLYEERDDLTGVSRTRVERAPY